MKTLEQTMIQKAKAALANSYAPYSGFKVSACICTESGELFTGVNVENASYGLTMCAEGSALCEMVSHGHRKIKSIVVMAGNGQLCPPCGACRQRLLEFSEPDMQVLLCDQEKVLQSCTLGELLPIAFTFNPLFGK